MRYHTNSQAGPANIDNAAPSKDLGDSGSKDRVNMPSATKRRKGELTEPYGPPNKMPSSAVQMPRPEEVMPHFGRPADPPVPGVKIPSLSRSELDILANEVTEKAAVLESAKHRSIASGPPRHQKSSLSRYLSGREYQASTSFGILAPREDSDAEIKMILESGDNVDPPPEGEEGSGVKSNANLTLDPVSNTADVQSAVKSVIQSASTLPYLPLVVNNDILNKRPLVSALERLRIQLHGHDSLEVDFLLDARTACIQLPLLSLPSTIDQLLSRATMLAYRFEHLIFIFALYPTEKANRAILPNPWNSATRDAFGKFEGRLKRQLAVKLGSTYQGQFSHTINVYLSDTSMTIAALLRVHIEQAQMPLPPTNLFRWTNEPLEEIAYDWLLNELDSVSWSPTTASIRKKLICPLFI